MKFGWLRLVTPRCQRETMSPSRQLLEKQILQHYNCLMCHIWKINSYFCGIWTFLLYQLSFKNCSGEKFIKLCINDIEAANSPYNKLAIFVIEKVPKSQCFKEINFLNSRCVFSLFGGSVKEVHPEKYRTSNWYIPCSSSSLEIKVHQSIFWPPNTTSTTQLIDKPIKESFDLWKHTTVKLSSARL